MAYKRDRQLLINQIDNYIYYKTENYLKDWESKTFNAQPILTAQTLRDNFNLGVKSAYAKAYNSIKMQDGSGQTVANFLQQVGSKQGLDEIYQDAAQEIERAFANYSGFADFQTVLGEGYSILSAIKNANATKDNKIVSSDHIDAFFNTLEQAQILVQGASDPTLAVIRARAKSNNPIKLTEKELKDASDIARYINEAMGKGFAKGKELDFTSFLGTLRNIYNRALGEQVVANAFEWLLNNPDLHEIIVGNLVINTDTIKTQLTGSWAKDSFKKGAKTFKADVLNNNMLQYRVTGGNGVYNFNLSAGGISAKWYKSIDMTNIGKSDKVTIIGHANLLDHLQKLQGPNTLTYAYNTIVHEGRSNTKMDQLKNTLAASFFQEWLMGSGNWFEQGAFDTTDFLFINGKVYSTLNIVKQVIDNSFAQRGFTDKQEVKVSFKGIQAPGNINKKSDWENTIPLGARGHKAETYALAEARNAALRDSIAAIELSAKLNINFLNTSLPNGGT